MPTLADKKTLGIQGKIYVGAAGSTPTVVYPDATEATLSIKNDKAKYATRGQRRKTARATTQELSLEFTVVKDFTDPSFVLLHAAAIAGSPIAIKTLDNTGGYGWDADWVPDAEEGQPLDGFDTVKFSCDFTSDYRALTEINPS